MRSASDPSPRRADLESEPPLRAPLFSAEQMGLHGKALASAHRVHDKPAPDLLLERLRDNQLVLDRACGMLTEAALAHRALTPAGEWLLDNIYLIEEQVSIARRHLPKGYSRELPRLVDGNSEGLPRVYDIALNAISHGDGRVDAESLSRFVAAYQTVTPLRLGELWAIPIMLRLALIENLRRVSARIIADRVDRNLADLWADRLTAVAETDPKCLVMVAADMARSDPPVASAFVAELARRLQGQSSALALPLTWVEQWLGDRHLSIEQMVQAENQQQAADQVSVSNSIGSLRFLAMMDWREFVETMSVVERTLLQDPNGTYGVMDFATRDSYRHAAEQLARRGGLQESEVAEAALELARTGARTHGTDDIAAHVGYYLIDDGRPALEDALSPRYGVGVSMRKTARRIPLLAYTAPIALIVTFFTQGLILQAQPAAGGLAVLWAIGVLCVIAFSELGVAVVNWAATLLATPRALPRLDYTDGIPTSARTLVVVPTMLGSVQGVQELAEALEVRFLANRDGNLHFALLSDFLDADQPTLPGDEALLDAARRAIESLNTRYARGPEAGGRGDIFFLFHRAREWNAGEASWIGPERKRGKLAALNAMLRSGERDAFSCIVGNTAALGNVRYVITLDTDTQLPRDAARELVGTLAHPLNQARFDPGRGVVTRGYGILQPRVGISMSGQARSWYARLYGSEPGIDPYTRAISDVYQDLFSEGSFVGKGIYDIDAFDAALAGTLPDNRVLSHDLLEGCYARAGLVSDVQLYEDHPSRYAVDVRRRHRWIRGDWQLLPWIWPWARRADGRRVRNPLSMLSRGKLVDNLRRSLVPAAMTALLVLGWLLPVDALRWTLWVLSILVLPPLLASMIDLANRPPDLPLRPHLHQALAATVHNFARAPLALACLPFEAHFSLDAIGRTLWRTAVSRRRLLQWAPSSEVERTLGDSLAGSLRTMWFGPAFAVGVGMAIALVQPAALPVALPVLAAWLSSPVLMWWLGRPRVRRDPRLSSDQLQFLRRLSRRTWGFFESHVTDEDHWLPPDNVQEHPSLVVARRTSPTNIGLSLLADLSAYDFGYVPLGTLMERNASTLRTLESLPRHRGHFYNWYDTETLAPLPPRYISTVDSGNLAGHLLTLRQGLLALRDAPVLAPATWQGLYDTLDVLLESRGGTPADGALVALRNAVLAARESPPSTLRDASLLLTTLRGLAYDVVEGGSPPYDIVVEDTPAMDDPPRPRTDPRAEAAAEAAHWARALLVQCMAVHDDLLWLSPWLTGPEDEGAATHVAGIPSLGQLVDAAGTDADPASAAFTAASRARERITELERLAHVAGQFAQQDYDFLYDPARHLLAIGYNVDEQRRDQGFYDLLASEARLCSFVTIAQGRLPQESWFALGRLLTEVDGDATLLSWSGSMFEYLMPQLVMPSYEGALLDQTSRNSVQRQIDYGRQRDVPWGISESGYNLVDTRMNYQYRAFGVPGLGLKRGLAQDLVIAPYASMMALMVAPEAACENLQRLTDEGFTGRFGLYEAIDYTAARLPRGQDYAVIRSFMVHHQGMGLLSLAYLLCDQPMQQRFVADPEFQATLLLLQERIPRTGAFHPHAAEVAGASPRSEVAETELRIFRGTELARPAVQILSNGRYHVMVSSAGGGYSRVRDMAVTRWREDATRDHWGSFCFLRDAANGDFWSTTQQPCMAAIDGCEAIFSDAKAEFRGRRNGFETHTEIAVSPEDDIELRRLRITNRSGATRTIEVTSYAEVVLAPAISDELHPAFSNLFVQTDLVRGKQAIVCTRRPRGHDETPPWMFHLLAVHDAHIDAISYETDRARFLGRGNTLQNPDALTIAGELSDSEGSVLDPIVSIRGRITLLPGQTATVDMVTGVGAIREACTDLIDKYRDRRLADRVFDLAWTHSQVVRHQINASQRDAQLYERMAGLVLYADPALRADPAVLLQNRRGQSGLWGQAISGDYPVVLLKIADAANIELVRQLVQAHAYWRLKGLAVDLVIWNEDQAGYRQQLQDQIMGLIAAGIEAHVIDRPGGIFVRPTQQISHEDRVLVQTVARVIISDARGSLSEQIGRRAPVAPPVPLLEPAPVQLSLVAEGAPLTLSGPAAGAGGDAPAYVPSDLSHAGGDDTQEDAVPPAEDPWPFDPVAEGRILGNGLGGFSPDGREYIIDLAEGQTTPAPWSNVLANAQFGCVVSESSPGYTWAENAHEFRLTPWHNDPVSDSAGEAFYLRDEDSGKVWSPMPLPRRGTGHYRTRHGFGYSVYEHVEDGIASELWVYVDVEHAVKFSLLKLRNRSDRPRRLSATGYVEWILGDLHAKTQMHVLTEIDGDSGVLTARNPYNTEFEGRVAFFDIDPGGGERSLTGDRAEFLGRNGNLRHPAALLRQRLSGRIGAGLDPCAAIQVGIDLDPGQESETVFRLGMGSDWGEAVALARRTRGLDAAYDALDAVRLYWLRTLGTIQVETPEPSVDVLANGWLLYQTIGCRFLARSGYYQSGGAFGFRDQLQDTMAMVHAEPQRARAHLLLSAAHQFPQGDVLHWWHPPQDRGVRTRCSDDYLWLPLAACRYVAATGDTGVLDEPVAYIEGRPVNADEESYYDLPLPSTLRESLYQHCVRSLRRGLELLGERGLPLIATGDWNDGMNRVGERGQGESVWLGFFLFDALTRFSALARSRGDRAFAEHCLTAADSLRANLEKHAWDGAWYRRAWFDNGAPLGSTESDECRIDSIAQSWSVLSGAGDRDRTRQAMASLDQHLVRRDAGLVQLLDPPFDKTPQDPGYIRGYVPGVRENGGQYTHAAIWATMAFAHMGDSARAWDLLRMINPVNHGSDPESTATYKVEPYVVAADVYAVAPHVGRGGWTWYTGSAGWMYRLMVESLLGLQREGDTLRLAPCIPHDWPEYRLRYRFRDTVYRIHVRQVDAGEAPRLAVDGEQQPGMAIPLQDDRAVHAVDAWVARPPGQAPR
ncbi:GH36-type glycosyl hydrolase domain-containing protein [Lysobacter sp. A3-1-A15]|uniref:GH36-type glycosyl hydrolase domain-containing protein n=1 Tax=Novilysobacter viscosus TaxID=3098602 RepID=UPI002ED83001